MLCCVLPCGRFIVSVFLVGINLVELHLGSSLLYTVTLLLLYFGFGKGKKEEDNAKFSSMHTISTFGIIKCTIVLDFKHHHIVILVWALCADERCLVSRYVSSRWISVEQGTQREAKHHSTAHNAHTGLTRSWI